MGFFADMWNTIAGPDNTQLAVIDAIALAICHDGHISEEERQFAEGFVSSMLGVSQQEAYEQMSQGVARIQGRHPGEVLQHITSHLHDFESRRLAFLSAIGASRSEGWVDEGEAQLLDAMAGHFGFSPQQREQIAYEAAQAMG